MLHFFRNEKSYFIIRMINIRNCDNAKYLNKGEQLVPSPAPRERGQYVSKQRRTQRITPQKEYEKEPGIDMEQVKVKSKGKYVSKQRSTRRKGMFSFGYLVNRDAKSSCFTSRISEKISSRTPKSNKITPRHPKKLRFQCAILLCMTD